MYIIRNVRLETGFATISTGHKTVPEMVVTNTGLYDITIEDGIIKEVNLSSCKQAQEKNCRIYDAEGLLAIPSYIEKHAHIDKTYYGEKWRAVTAPRNIPDIVESEAELYPTFDSSVCERARRLINTFIKHGSTTIRTHVDIVKDKKIGHLEQVLEAFGSYGNHIDWEIVAFPQHGLLRSDSFEAVAEALENGATHLGGLDPYIIDKDREKSLRKTFELAAKYNVNIDYHLHEGREIGLESFNQIVQLIKEYNWQNRFELSHAMFLSHLDEKQKEQVAYTMAENGINLISQVPINGDCPDFPYFDKFGVKTALGVDCINDSWWPYGDGSVLEKLTVFGRLFAIRTEKQLAESLKYITGYKTPLDTEGSMVWPKPGDKANLLLIDASCSAEVVGRKRENTCVIHNGNIVYGNPEKSMN